MGKKNKSKGARRSYMDRFAPDIPRRKKRQTRFLIEQKVISEQHIEIDRREIMSKYDWTKNQTYNYVKKDAVSDENKLMLQKLMVGHFIETIPETFTKSVCYVLQGNGVYEHRKNKVATFITNISKCSVPGLKSSLEEGWELNVPKIPANLLGEAVSFFREIYKEHSSEVFLQFYWDKVNSKYIIHCPSQVVSGASVRYENDEMFTDPDKVLVFEIHSHGSMGAFFSGTDDGDEKADRFYGVVGNIKAYFPELKLRMLIGGNAYEIQPQELFDISSEMYHIKSYPIEWFDKVKTHTPVVAPGHYGAPAVSYWPETESWGEKDYKEYYDKYSSKDYLHSDYSKEKIDDKTQHSNNKKSNLVNSRTKDYSEYTVRGYKEKDKAPIYTGYYKNDKNGVLTYVNDSEKPKVTDATIEVIEPSKETKMEEKVSGSKIINSVMDWKKGIF